MVLLLQFKINLTFVLFALAALILIWETVRRRLNVKWDVVQHRLNVIWYEVQLRLSTEVDDETITAVDKILREHDQELAQIIIARRPWNLKIAEYHVDAPCINGDASYINLIDFIVPTNNAHTQIRYRLRGIDVFVNSGPVYKLREIIKEGGYFVVWAKGSNGEHDFFYRYDQTRDVNPTTVIILDRELNTAQDPF